MNKTELLKYAEHGVRVRLSEMQLEINALARTFPHIVKNADGSIPSVLPIEAKPHVAVHNGSGPTAPKQRALSREARRPQIEAFLKAHPGATTKDVQKHLGVSSSNALVLLHKFARMQSGGGKGQPATWHLRAGRQG